MKKNLPPERRSGTKLVEQYSDENLNWNNIYTSRMQATKDVRLQIFQYKFLMRIIALVIYLIYILKCKIKEMVLHVFEYCTMEIEPKNPLLGECNHVHHFWTNLTTYVGT